MDHDSGRHSVVWNYFTKKDQYVATCNECNHNYSFRSSVSNLWKHYVLKHGKPPEDIDFSNSDSSDGERENSSNKKKSTWKYFDVLDSDKYEAHCKLCGTNITYDSISDLSKHVEEHNEKTYLDSEDDEYKQAKMSTKRKYSQVWKYFNPLDNHRAVCTICKRILRYSATVSNLRRHLVRKHPENKLPPCTKYSVKDPKTIIFSADGQLYEMETTTDDKVENEDDDDERKDPIEMDTIYFEELEDSMHETPTLPPTSTTNKKGHSPIKRKIAKLINNESNRYNRSEDESLNLIKTQPNIIRKNITMGVPQMPQPMGSLDYFGQYVVSLLKELPRSVSTQLQNDIITQIFKKKMEFVAQTMNNKKKNNVISISNNHLDSDTEPITVTIDTSDHNELVLESTETDELS